MKKIEKYIYVILIIILVGVIASATTYMLMKDKAKENDNKPTENNPTIKEDSVKFLKAYELNDKIIEEFEVTLNNKTNILKIEYTTKEYNGYYLTYGLTGTINNNEVYYDEHDNNDFTTYNIKENFNENNFRIIKGTDNKNYLLLQTMYNGIDIFDTSELYIYNDNLELISKDLIKGKESPDFESHDGFVIENFVGNIPCKFENNINPFYINAFQNISENNQFTKIENNNIYFLFPKLNFNNDPVDGTLEERVYTINNDKLEYKVINTYKITGVCQQV